ncbi:MULTISPECIES: AraC family transcriptional regulator [unclassified Pseudomonas]|uniref:AraC-like transcriptional regulator QhpR n=1 Tax=unclassified Pseudomonas TaxID=196821 RepID=UPI000D3A4879|nr:MULTISPECIES: AraC family transcriptional regulator [unclassified Pseudomonas]RAU45078.1 AraC family transcriptional regulator [Pseudomonas sp. RIT 409]RAU51472.1 AraC family transcriptional regulator [Pseudomonas sp. RIT 412]
MFQHLLPTAVSSPSAANNRGVLSAAANGLDGFIVQHGGDLDRVFGRSGIDPEHLLHPTLSLPLTNYCKVLEEAARQTGCDNFGLRYGQQFQPKALGLLGYIGLCSPTLEDALINFAEAFPFHQHSTLIELVDQGECYRFDYQVRHGAIHERRQDAELTMGMAMNLVRHVLGPQWAPRQVAFEHARPQDWHEHRDAFHADVQFAQGCNSLLIPKRDVAGHVMPGSDPILLMLIKDAIRQLGDSGSEANMLDRARQTILANLHLGEPALEAVAHDLGLSEWTLQRKLRDLGLSFSQLVDQIRRETALAHLKQQHLSVTQLASLLGYSETSAFSRAFKRWFGTSPRQWRSAATTPAQRV